MLFRSSLASGIAEGEGTAGEANERVDTDRGREVREAGWEGGWGGGFPRLQHLRKPLKATGKQWEGWWELLASTVANEVGNADRD